MTAVHPGELLTKVRIPAKGDARDGWASVDARQGGHRDRQRRRERLRRHRAARDRLRRRDAGRRHRQRRRDRRQGRRPRAPNLDPPADVHASADYRRHLAEVLAARAVRDAA